MQIIACKKMVKKVKNNHPSMLVSKEPKLLPKKVKKFTKWTSTQHRSQKTSIFSKFLQMTNNKNKNNNNINKGVLWTSRSKSRKIRGDKEAPSAQIHEKVEKNLIA
jgi:hypothetical protein